MLFEIFYCLVGFIAGILFCGYFLENESECGTSGDVKGCSPRVTYSSERVNTDWFEFLSKFFYAKTKDNATITGYALSQLKKEISIVLHKINGIKSFEISHFSLGDLPPLLDSMQVIRVEEKHEEIEELVLQTNVSYTKGVSFSLAVAHVIGNADLTVSVEQLSGPAVFGFTSTPCHHWYFSFTEEPQMDIRVKVRGQLLPFKRKIEALICDGIKNGIRKMYVLPSMKPRFKPFFSTDAAMDMKKLIDEPFIERLKVDLSESSNRSSDDHERNDMEEEFVNIRRVLPYTSGTLEVELERFCNLSLSFASGMEHVFVTCSIDSNPITENVVLSSNSSKPSREFLNFTVDVDELRNFYEFSESKVAVDEAEELASSDKYRVLVKKSLVLEDFESALLEGDVIIAVNGIRVNSEQSGEADKLFTELIGGNEVDYLKLFVMRRLSLSYLFSRNDDWVAVGSSATAEFDVSNGAELMTTRQIQPAESLSPPMLRHRTNRSATHPLQHTNALSHDRLATESAISVSYQVKQNEDVLVVDEQDNIEKCEEVGVGEGRCLGEDTLVVIGRRHSLDLIQTPPGAEDENGLLGSDLGRNPVGLSGSYVNLVATTDNVVENGTDVDKVENLTVPDENGNLAQSYRNGEESQNGLEDRESVTILGSSHPFINSSSGASISCYGQETKRSGLLPATSVIDCSHSLPLASARCFHFSIYPNKTEYFNMTVWGVSGPTGLGRVNNDDKSATASSATSSHFHFPLANLSLPIGHVIKLCSSTNSSLSCSKTFQLSQSRLQWAAPANTAGLELNSLSGSQVERILSRCFGTARIHFRITDLREQNMATGTSKSHGTQRATHVNVNPPPQSFLQSFINSSKQTRGETPAGHKRNLPLRSSHFANRVKPKLQDSKVANAVKNSINASLPKFSHNRNIVQNLMTAPPHSNSNESVVSNNSNSSPSISNGNRFSNKIGSVKGSMKKMASPATGLLMKDSSSPSRGGQHNTQPQQSTSKLMEKYRESQQRVFSKTRPFKQMFNRNKTNPDPPHTAATPAGSTALSPPPQSCLFCFAHS
ncbi:uncharacterized protein LOC142354478 isoform X2 [Convolutriloba macropyga]|uniref:uncharacterized protein LOC142354478 isoform X2 n=1 Tax=Convolutriloba macropyga TaxID=536237 RepID=UPI003F52354B